MGSLVVLAFQWNIDGPLTRKLGQWVSGDESKD